MFVTLVVADDIAVYTDEDKQLWTHRAAFESTAMTAASCIQFMSYRVAADAHQGARAQSIYLLL